MANALDKMFTSQAIAAYYTDNALYREPYFGESKFPAKKKAGLDLSFIKGAKRTPVALSISAFDANTIPRKRGSVSKLEFGMPYFKNEYQVDEKLRQDLIMLGENGNPAMVASILQNLFNDTQSLIDDANLVPEIMRMQLLTTGVVSWSDNGQKQDYDYELDDEQKVTPATLWSDSSATPLDDIQSWMDAMVNRGAATPAEILMNTATLRALAKTDVMKNAIYVMANGKVTPSTNDVKNFLLAEFGLTVYLYDKQYKTAGGSSVKFVPDGTCVLMPATPLGNTWYGTTPAEADLMSESGIQVSLVSTGVAIAKYKQINPVKTVVEASEIVLPSFEGAGDITIASVL